MTSNLLTFDTVKRVDTASSVPLPTRTYNSAAFDVTDPQGQTEFTLPFSLTSTQYLEVRLNGILNNETFSFQNVSPSLAGTWSHILYFNSRYFAFSGSNQYRYSSDGSSWTVVPGLPATVDSMFIYGSYIYILYDNKTIYRSLTGVDGSWSMISFSSEAYPPPNRGLTTVEAGGYLYVMGYTTILRTPDSTSWWGDLTFSNAGTPLGIYYIGGKVIAFYSLKMFYTTPGDIDSWTEVSNPYPYSPSALWYNGATAVFYSGTKSYTSSTGMLGSWSTGNEINLGSTPSASTLVNGIFYVGSYSPSGVKFSSDGVKWTWLFPLHDNYRNLSVIGVIGSSLIFSGVTVSPFAGFTYKQVPTDFVRDVANNKLVFQNVVPLNSHIEVRASGVV